MRRSPSDARWADAAADDPGLVRGETFRGAVIARTVALDAGLEAAIAGSTDGRESSTGAVSTGAGGAVRGGSAPRSAEEDGGEGDDVAVLPGGFWATLAIPSAMPTPAITANVAMAMPSARRRGRGRGSCVEMARFAR